MNPELQKAIADVLAVVKDGATFAAAAARQELPLLVQEYLRIGVVSELVTLAFWCGAAVLLYVSGRKLRALDLPPKIAVPNRYDNGTRTVDNMGYLMAQFFGHWALPVVAWVVLGVGLITTVPTIVRILVAPRVYLLETLTRLVQ